MAASRSVNILIQARDQATRQFGNVRQALTRLTGGFAGLRTVAIGAFSAIGGAITAVLAPMAKITLMLAPFLALGGAIRTMTTSLRDFGRQEAAVRNLATALELNRENARELVPEFERFASELQNITTMGDEATLELMKQASVYGVQADQIRGVTQASIGLAEALGIDQARALQYVARAREGDTTGLQRYLPALRAANTEAERQAIINEAAAKGFELAKDATNTYRGSMQQLSNVIGDFRERIGEAMAPAILRIGELIRQSIPVMEQWLNRMVQGVQSLRPVWQSFSQFVGQAVRVVQTVVSTAFQSVAAILNQFGANVQNVSGAAAGFFDLLRGGAMTVGRMLVGAFTAAEVAVTNWRSVLQIAVASIRLGFTSLVEEIHFHFTQRVPSVLRWFADNWQSIFGAMFRVVGTMLDNSRHNYVETYKGIVKFLLSINWLSAFRGFMQAQATINEKAFELYAATFRKIGEFIANPSMWQMLTPGGIAKALVENTLGPALREAEKEVEKEGFFDNLRSPLEGVGEAFEGIFDDFPDMKRAITDQERGLISEIQRLGGELGDDFQAKFRERMKGLESVFGGAIAGSGGDAGQFEGIQFDPIKIEDEGKEILSRAVRDGVQIRGPEAVESRFLTRAPGQSPELQVAERQAKLAKETADQSKKTNTLMERIMRLWERLESRGILVVDDAAGGFA